MPTFQDSLNRSWSIEVNYQSVRKLREELQVDLLSVIEKDSDILRRLANDEVFLVDVVGILLADQIQTKGLSVQQFAEGMLGDGIQRAVDALVEGIANFSRPQKGAVIRKTWGLLTEAQNHASQRIVNTASSPLVKAKVDQLVDQALAAWTTSSGELPES